MKLGVMFGCQAPRVDKCPRAVPDTSFLRFRLLEVHIQFIYSLYNSVCSRESRFEVRDPKKGCKYI